jgi:structural maintenance of chromosome 1
VRFSVGSTLICDSVEEAKQIAYHQPNGQRNKVVTIDGTCLLKNGSIQGGLSTIQSRARKWDEKVYDDLKAARDKLMREGAGASDTEEARTNIEAQDVQSRLGFTKNRMKQLEAEVAAVAKKNQTHEAERKDAEKQLTALKQRHDDYTAKVNTADSAMEGVQKKVKSIEDKIFGTFQKKVGIPNVAELEQKEAKKEKERTEQRQRMTVVIHKLKTTIEGQSKKFGEKSLDDVEKSVKKINDEIKSCQKDHDDYKRVLDKIVKKQDNMQQQVTGAKADLDSLEAAIRNRSLWAENVHLTHVG